MIVKIVSICLVAILPSTLSNEAYFNVMKPKLDAIAKSGDCINDVIKLTNDGYLGKGAFGLTYKGRLNKDPTEYAIKITYPRFAVNARKEYEMYTYLDAINNSATEAYGIPVIYYFGTWHEQNNVYVMAMTLCMERKIFEDLDVLIMFREFIRISKYIHSCGVRHNDIKIDNIMFRANKGFIIDFNLAAKMTDWTCSGSLFYLSRRCHRYQAQYPMDDWESFLYSMCEVVGINLDWQNRSALKSMRETEQETFIFGHKRNVNNTMRRIQEYGNEKLKPIFVQFAKYVFSDDTIPPYDEVYRMINSNIINVVQAGDPVSTSWILEMEHFNISTIKQPTYGMRQYPYVDFNYFTKIQPSTSMGKNKAAY